MKKAPILLGTLRRASSSADLEDDERDLQYDLKSAGEIVIADDNNALQNFGDSLFTAPAEDIIEGKNRFSRVIPLFDFFPRLLCSFRLPPLELSGEGGVQDQCRN